MGAIKMKMVSFLSRNIIEKKSTNFMILFLSFSNLVNSALTIVSGLLVALWVLPEELGSFNAFNIISGYIVLVQLGIPSALGRELPFHLGKGDREEAYKYASVGQYWQKLLGLLALLTGVFVAIVAFILDERELAAGSLTVGVVTWQVLYVTKYLKVLYRTNQDFNRLSQIKLINALFAFASIVFVWLYGFYGLCIRAILSAVVDWVFTYKWRPIRAKATWSLQHFKTLMHTGLPMFGVANIYGLWPLVQRTVVLSLGGTEALGLFALSVMTENSMVTISSSINSVIYPRMATLWGEGASVGEIMHSVYKPIFMSIILLLVTVPFGWWLLPLFVDYFLPNYKGGIGAAQWMLLVGAIEPSTAVSNIYNVMRNQRDRLIVYLAGVCLWAFTVYGLYLVYGFSLVIFPVGMLVAFVTMIFLNLIHIRRYWQLKAV